MDFPNSPNIGDTISNGTRAWQWSGTTWDRVIIGGGMASFVVTDTLIELSITPLPSPIGKDWSLINYV